MTRAPWLPAPVPPLQPPAFSAWLDCCRWIAASVVLVQHAGGILLLPLTYQDPQTRPALQFGYSFVAGYGHYAVMVFFVISGYLVGGSLCAEAARGRVSLKRYAARRVARLCTVLWPGLLLGLCLHWAGTNLLQGQGTSVYASIDADSGMRTLACNAVFLQGIACEVYAGNLSLWSLTHEVWYYAAFALLVSAIQLRGDLPAMAWRVVPLTGLVVGVALFQYANVSILAYFTIWLLGVAVAVLTVTPHRIPHWAGLVAFLAAASLFRVLKPALPAAPEVRFAVDLLVALAFSGWLYLARCDARLAPPPGGKLHARLAGFSFSLYCIHVPVLMIFSALLMEYSGTGYRVVPHSARDWLTVAAGLALAMGAAQAFYWLTEHHTDRVKRWLLQRLS